MDSSVESPRKEESQHDPRMEPYHDEFAQGLSWRGAIEREMMNGWRSLFFRAVGVGLVGFLGPQFLMTVPSWSTMAWAVFGVTVFGALLDVFLFMQRTAAISQAYADRTGRLKRPSTVNFALQLFTANIVIVLIAFAIARFELFNPVKELLQGSF